MASYLDPGAVCGTFLVGDGTLCGEPPIPHYDKSSLVLGGETFTTNVYEDFEGVAAGKPSLVLKAKAVTVRGDSTLTAGRPILYLRGKATNGIVPIVVAPGKSVLVLKGMGLSLKLSQSPVVGKAVLYLMGKPTRAQIPGLVVSIPQDVNLVPSAEQSLALVPTVEQSLDLVPTTEEFR